MATGQKPPKSKKKRKQKLLYRPVGIALGMAGGALASTLFAKTWALLGDGDAPDAMDEERTWREILLAAALQGAIFAVVKAAVDRSGATGVRKLTGIWPS
ncbi:DUF4235 domain-containing protein [Streptomyces sp. LP05-1]|uniref:DUF4235 domain-containing protein n=1 Tax=Streptomyces pyxinae TaxID=2970734 RepID=A0ABT2CJ35_9ACTN|nr:DUF4235 domain-containing protein [Streptomyces sp. LP05-1]MCS0637305.1 DUF4235 domain-containing protein [Streptomyces sp. LP05-1]